jgi:hypothetical protein
VGGAKHRKVLGARFRNRSRCVGLAALFQFWSNPVGRGKASESVSSFPKPLQMCRVGRLVSMLVNPGGAKHRKVLGASSNSETHPDVSGWSPCSNFTETRLRGKELRRELAAVLSTIPGLREVWIWEAPGQTSIVNSCAQVSHQPFRFRSTPKPNRERDELSPFSIGFGPRSNS